MNKIILTCISILKYAIKNKCSLRKACSKYKKRPNFLTDYKRRGLERDYSNKKITHDQYAEFINLYNEFLYIDEEEKELNKLTKNNQFDVELTEEEIKEIEYDAEKDDKYDERSIGNSIKDDTGKITHYYYKILVRDEPPLEGNFSREEMDKIYRLYSNLDGAGLTLRAVSREFHNLTFRDFKRILRAFNITKSSVPVAPHILEEKSADDITQIIIRNKENLVLKKLDTERNKLFEKYLLDAQKKLIKYQQHEEWISEIVDKYFKNNKPQTGDFLNLKKV